MSYINFYRENGYVVISDVTDNFRRIALQADLNANSFIENVSKDVRNWTEGKGQTYKHVMNPHVFDSAFSELIHSKEIKELANYFYAESTAYVTHSKLSIKQMGARQKWLPHQDHAYKSKLNNNGMTIAVFLEDCSRENGTIQIFPRSHLLGKLEHARAASVGEDSAQLVVDSMPNIQPIDINGRAGDVLIFNFNTIHQSGSNEKGGYRKIFIFEVEPKRFFALNDAGEPAIILNGEGARNIDKIASFFYAFYKRGKAIAFGLSRRIKNLFGKT